MQISVVFSLFCLVASALANTGATPAKPGVPEKQLVCYYDSSSFVKEGKRKVRLQKKSLMFGFKFYLFWKFDKTFFELLRNTLENKKIKFI